MSRPATLAPSATRIEEIGVDHPRRRQIEDELIAGAARVPLSWLSGAELAARASDSILFVATDDERLVGAAGVTSHRSRAFPGFGIWRVERFHAEDDQLAAQLLQRVITAARVRKRVLRVMIECFAVDEAELERCGLVCAQAGFGSEPCTRMYESTILLDLAPVESELFANLHATARRHVRAVEKQPVEVREITDPFLSDRLDDLLRETIGRTGGEFHAPDWTALMQLNRRRPDRSRLVGLFRQDSDGPSSLLGFAWGCNHGDHAHYATAASTRATELKIPILYPLLWDLICWSRVNGARTFDLGGVSHGTHGSDDRLGGISDFKRYFSRDVCRVGSQWSRDTHPAAKVAKLLSSVKGMVGR